MQNLGPSGPYRLGVAGDGWMFCLSSGNWKSVGASSFLCLERIFCLVCIFSMSCFLNSSMFVFTRFFISEEVKSSCIKSARAALMVVRKRVMDGCSAYRQAIGSLLVPLLSCVWRGYSA